MAIMTDNQTTKKSSFAGTLELILSKNSKPQGRNDKSRVTKDCSPYLKYREMMG